jgi:predicted PP-loop superfamily ATPase
LENEWARQGICSRCHRDVDTSLDEQISELEARAQTTGEKLGRIRRLIMITPDTALRPEIMSILDEQ